MKSFLHANMIACAFGCALLITGCEPAPKEKPFPYPLRSHIEPSEKAKMVDDLPPKLEETGTAYDAGDDYFPGSPVPGGAMFGGIG